MAHNAHVLIVDDVADNIQVAMNILREDNYKFSFASNGEKALTLVQEGDTAFDLILLDVMMPGLDGFEVCSRLKAHPKSHDIPIIFLTAKIDSDSISKGFELGGVDYVSKPFHATELLARVKNHVQLYQAKQLLKQQNISLETKAKYIELRLLSELENSQKELIWMLTEVMESTSDETGKHIRRVAELSALFAELHPALNEDDVNILFHASPMHDIGKITIPHDLLHKPGKFTEAEFEIMKKHTTNAYELLSKSNRKLVKGAATIAYQHHEKWNGSGYPQQLKGTDIHIYGRIVALADVLDALTHARCYKKAWEIHDVLRYVNEQRGEHFDPELVDIFNDNLGRFLKIIQIK
jgi:putative two-component system response regulator